MNKSERLRRATMNGETVVLMKCHQSSDDYRCWKCGLEFTLTADSDLHAQRNKGHVCAASPVRNHFSSR